MDQSPSSTEHETTYNGHSNNKIIVTGKNDDLWNMQFKLLLYFLLKTNKKEKERHIQQYHCKIHSPLNGIQW
jgi:hypothetical protein